MCSDAATCIGELINQDTQGENVEFIGLDDLAKLSREDHDAGQ